MAKVIAFAIEAAVAARSLVAAPRTLLGRVRASYRRSRAVRGAASADVPGASSLAPRTSLAESRFERETIHGVSAVICSTAPNSFTGGIAQGLAHNRLPRRSSEA